MADIQVANTDADLSGNTVVTEENAYTITGLHTFSRSTSAPFACVSGAAVVTYLDSDKLDGQEGAYYLAAANFTGTLAVNRGGTGAATFTDGGVLLGSGTSAITAMAVLSDGEMIVGDGSGDPVAESGATLRTSIGVGTGDSPQFTAVELGHATDTTLARASAGDVNIEGNIVYRAGGTDVPVSDGGTGASSLTDGGVLLGSGTGAITPMAVLADGEMIVGDGSGDPVAESGATLRTSIGVGTGASPTFTGLTITGTGASSLDVGGGLNIGTGNVALVTAAGKITALSSTEVDNLSGAALTSLDAGNISAGTLAVARGGTGATSLTDGGVLLGSGTGAVTAMSVLSDSEMIVGDGSGDPVAESGSTLRASIGCDSATNLTSGTLANARLPSNVDLGGTLDVTGATTLDSTVTVAGASTLNNTVVINQNGVTPLTMRRDSGNNGHGVGFTFKMGDAASATAAHEYGTLYVSIADNTNGGEDGNLTLNLSDDGSLAEVFRIFGASGGMGLGSTDDPGSKSLNVAGTLSKGSGSFKISHPLPALTDSKYLVHSFIEGPKADLIYRGTAILEDGEATVDLDAAAGMTTGTWVLLCRDEQVFTSNETSWKHVRGSVTGSTLTIECEEATSTDTISWMVVACRQDDHMKDSGTIWTDEDGYPIVEPDKPAPSGDPGP